MDGQPATGANELRSASPEQTRDVGRRLGETALPGTVLALIGPLGAGKTQLAKGVAESLGVTGVVNSPTFVLMNEHAGRLVLYHIDAYRLDEPGEALAAGLLDERQAGGVTVIEWADRLGGWLLADRLEIELTSVGGEPTVRTIRWRAFGTAHEELAQHALGDSAGGRRMASAT